MTTRTRKARAIVHGAISIVNAIATGRDPTLGISLKVTAEVEFQRGHGVGFVTGKNGDKLINNIIQKTIPKEIIDNNMITIKSIQKFQLDMG